MSSTSTRASVKKLSCGLKLSREGLGTSQNVEIVDDCAAAQIEEILAHAPIASTSALPVPNMGEGMLNRHPFAQRARGIANGDDRLLSRADEGFRALSLDWHAAQTDPLRRLRKLALG